MKSYRFGSFAFAAIFVSFLSLVAAPVQVEFTAELLEVRQDASLGTVLVMGITPANTLSVRVTIATEIEDQQGFRISAGDLQVGDHLEVEGAFTDAGLLAREVRIADRKLDFEFRGLIEQLDPSNRTITVLGFEFFVPNGAEIKNQEGNLIPFSQLNPDDLVKVEGMIQDDRLVARQIKRLAGDLDFAEIRLIGQVVRITPSQIDVQVEGVGEVPVLINSRTEIRGDLFVGALVKVKGAVNPDLTVSARRISVVRPLEAVPDEVRLDFQQSHRIDLVLDQVLGADLPLAIQSQDPRIATPSTDGVTIPAGQLSASFEVLSGAIEGVTRIDVTAPQSLGGFSTQVKVEVETVGDGGAPPDPGELTEVKWSPDRITGLRDQTVSVTLSLTRTVSQDLTVDLFLKEGPGDLVSFPSQITIPAGQRTVPLDVAIGSGPGRAKVRAALPISVGGDTDDLEVEIRFEEDERVELSWEPDDVEIAPNQGFTVQLRLDRPAPFDFSVAIRLKDGDPTLVSGMPSQIQFVAGSMQQEITVSAGAREGRVRFRAEAPFSLGGDKDELKIEIEN